MVWGLWGKIVWCKVHGLRIWPALLVGNNIGTSCLMT